MELDQQSVVTITVGVLTAIAGVLGGSFWTYRWRLKEINLQFARDQRKIYYLNAREFRDKLYVPLYIKISTMYEIYLELRNLLKVDKNKDLEETKTKLNDFKNSFDEFAQEIERTRNKGLGAYLIGTLEEEILELKNFTGTSLKQGQDGTLTSVTVSADIFGIKFDQTKLMRVMKNFSISDTLMSAIPFVQINIEPTVISADIGSIDFEKRFIELCVIIKGGIREVTLGQAK